MLHLMIKARSDFTHVISEIWFVVLAYIAYQLTRCDGFGFALAWKEGGGGGGGELLLCPKNNSV